MSRDTLHGDGVPATIVVTGGSGFIGSAVVALAVEQGHRVVSLIRECEPLPAIGGVGHRMIDWSDAPGLAAVLADVSPQTVIHCAGSTGRAGEDVSALYRANVETVWDLLTAVKSGCPRAGVVLLSSAAVYGPEPMTPTREEAFLAAQTHYAASKVLAEELSRTFAAIDGVRCVVARPFNVVGPREPAGSVTARIIRQFESAGDEARVAVNLRESASIRDFVDVEDVASALLFLGERGVAGAAYNVCSGRGVSIAEMVAAVARVEGRDFDLTVDDPSASGTASIGSPDALTLLGWAPRHDLEGSLRRMLAFRRP